MQLYELCGEDRERRFSPYTWRIRLALAHKGLAFETCPTRFTEIPAILGGGQTSVPVLVDGEAIVRDSFAIAEYLEETYPDRPALFGGDGGRRLSRFVESWVTGTLHPQIVGLVVADIHAILSEADKTYFRQSREGWFKGVTLEEKQAGREEHLPAFQASLDPLRAHLKRAAFMGGEAPLFADFILAGTLTWPMKVSDLELFEPGDPVLDWYRRVMAINGGRP